LSKIFSDLGI